MFITYPTHTAITQRRRQIDTVVSDNTHPMQAHRPHNRHPYNPSSCNHRPYQLSARQPGITYMIINDMVIVNMVITYGRHKQ
jgi:hypothetical protein